MYIHYSETAVTLLQGPLEEHGVIQKVEKHTRRGLSHSNQQHIHTKCLVKFGLHVVMRYVDTGQTDRQTDIHCMVALR